MFYLYYQPTNQPTESTYSVAHCPVSNISCWPADLSPGLLAFPQDPAAWTSQAPSPGLTPAAASQPEFSAPRQPALS